MVIMRPNGKIQTSVLVSPDMFELAKEHKIKLTEAMNVGLNILLADKYVIPYDNNLDLYRKMKKYQSIAEEALKELKNLKDKLLKR